MAALTKKKQLGDLIRGEDNRSRSRIAGTVYNNTGETITLTDPMGAPLVKNSSDQWSLAIAANDAADSDAPIVGLLLHNEAIDAVLDAGVLGGTGKQYAILVRDAIVSATGIADTDSKASAGTFSKTRLATQLASIGILVRTEPPAAATETQTT